MFKLEKMAFLNKNSFLYLDLYERALLYTVRFPFLILYSQQGSRKISLNSSQAQTLDRITGIHLIPCSDFILLPPCKGSQCPSVAAANIHSAVWCSKACSRASQNTEARRGFWGLCSDQVWLETAENLIAWAAIQHKVHLEESCESINYCSRQCSRQMLSERERISI